MESRHYTRRNITQLVTFKSLQITSNSIIQTERNSYVRSIQKSKMILNLNQPRKNKVFLIGVVKNMILVLWKMMH